MCKNIDSEYCQTLESSSLTLKSLHIIPDFQHTQTQQTTQSVDLIGDDKLLLAKKENLIPTDNTTSLNEKYTNIENTPNLIVTSGYDIVVCNNVGPDSIVAVATATKNDKFIAASITDSSDCVVTTTAATAAQKHKKQNFEFSDVNSSNGGGDSVSNINELILHQI